MVVSEKIKGLYRNRFFSNLVLNFKTVSGKYLILLASITAIVWYVVYATLVIHKLSSESQQVTRVYADLIRIALVKDMDSESKHLVLERILEGFEVPIIITDQYWEPIIWKNLRKGPFWNRKPIVFSDPGPGDLRIVRKKIKDYRDKYLPKTIFTRDGTEKFGYLVFGDRPIANSLFWLPVFEMFLVIIIIFFVFISLKNILVSEKSSLWVGLAKETAHQLGTPMSSLMGWHEYLKHLASNEEDQSRNSIISQLSKICNEMEGDIKRLSKISSRFNQIGSRPELVASDLNEVIDESYYYFKARLPAWNKKIDLRRNKREIPKVALNPELMQWVLENLMRNAVDAIEKDEGRIEISTEYLVDKGIVRVNIKDTGRGVQPGKGHEIFTPGFTSKSRGWGLGLTLAKRIVENYHHGKIYVLWSEKGRGTIISIDLPIEMDLDKENV